MNAKAIETSKEIKLYRLKHVETGLFHTGRPRVWSNSREFGGWEQLATVGKIYSRRPRVSCRRSYWHNGEEHAANESTWVVESWTAKKESEVVVNCWGSVPWCDRGRREGEPILSGER